MCPALISEDELPGFQPHLVFVDALNRIIKPQP
jgi:hypothetical protein